MRKLGQAVLDILNPAAAGDRVRSRRVRFPESGLVDPVSFLFQSLGKAECLEHFHCPAGDTIRLAKLQGAGFLLHDTGSDVRECRKLSGKRKAGGTATDNEDIGTGIATVSSDNEFEWNGCCLLGLYC